MGKQSMNSKRVSPGVITTILVVLCFCLALAFRVIFPYDHVFTSEWIKFTGNDAWYHMRIIDNFVHNFPHFNSVDPYFIYGAPFDLEKYLFFDYLAAAIIWIIGLGSASQHLVDVVGVYIPAMIGSLTVVPVYFIGKTVFNRWAGIIAAGLLAILPGEFLGRTVLGFTDHHALEVLLTTTTMMFLSLAITHAGSNQLTIDNLRKGNWSVFRRVVIFSALAGIFMGMYFLSWRGAPIFLFIVLLFLFVMNIINHLKGKDTFDLFIVGLTFFIISLLLLVSMPYDIRYLAAMVIALCTVIVLYGTAYLLRKRQIRAIYYPLIILVFGVVGAGIFFSLKAELFLSVVLLFKRIIPEGARLATLEAQPILFPGGEFSMRVIWGNFTTGTILGVFGLGFLIYEAVKRNSTDKILIVIWSIVILIAMLLMRRFAYYFAVNMALLTGYFSWLLLQRPGLKENTDVVSTEAVSHKKSGKKSGKIKSDKRPGKVVIGIGIAFIILVVYVPNLGPAVNIASNPVFAPTDAWCESLTWLKDNTEEPFTDADYYYAQYPAPFKYPSSAYGIAAWWDYGYWITKIGHRLPICNPGGGDRKGIAQFLLSQDGEKASSMSQKLTSKYVIIDYDTATIKFHALPQYAGGAPAEYFDVYYTRQDDTRLKGDYYFYPEYYRSLAVRLYNFNGAAFTPVEVMVIAYKESVDIDGLSFKEIVDTKIFSTYQEAEEFVAHQDTDKYRIVGTDVFISPVSLASMGDYTLVFESTDSKTHPELGRIPEVKIFKYNNELN